MVRNTNWIQIIDQLIGIKICSLRNTKGLSRYWLAKKIGVTQQQLDKYEKGINRISPGRLVLIAQALEVKVNFFFESLEHLK